MIKTSRILSIILTLIIASASWTGAKAGRPAIVGNYYYLLFDSEFGTNTAILTNKRCAGTAAGSNSYSGTVIIPESFQTENVNNELATYTVIGIDDYAFYGSTGLIKVDIPKTVVSIGKMAFDGCTRLQKITVNPENQSFYAHDDVLYDYDQTELIVSVKTKTGKFIVPEDVKKINEFAFHDCGNITEIELPNGLKEIGKAAFWECTSLASVTIPNSVESIGEDAFLETPWWNTYSAATENQYGNIIYINLVAYQAVSTDITSCTFKDGTVSISDNAFSSCDGLTTVNIPNSVTSIGDNAFYSCTNLASVTIPNSVTSIGGDAFYSTPWWNTYSADTENHYGNIIYINQVAYQAVSTDITSCTFKDGTVSISNYAFASCTNLASVNIPNSVTSIGDYAFYNCTSLASVTCWATTPPTLDCNAFLGCENLTTIYVLSDLVDTYKAAENWSDYAYNIQAIDNAWSSGSCVAVLDNNGTLTISGTGAMADYGVGKAPWNGSCASITKVIIEDGVTSIGANAFYNCTSLSPVTIGSSVTSIGEYAFKDCTSLAFVTCWATSVPTLGTNAFNNNTARRIIFVLSNLVGTYKAAENWSDYADKIKAIGNAWSSGSCVAVLDNNGTLTISGTGAMANYSSGDAPWFNSRASITKVVIEDGVTSIGNYAFADCTNLASVNIPNSVTSIGNSAFQSCTSLESITIGNSVTSIGANAFQSCTSLGSVTFADNSLLTSIGKNAFIYCSSLASINIPSSVTSIGNYAFYQCTNLASISVEEENTMYDSRNNCNAIIETETNTLILGCKNTVIPNSVTSIGDRAFQECNNLGSASIPNSVMSIGEFAFASCTKLASVTIGNSVTSIGNYAFADCTSLTSVTIGSSVKSIGDYAFNNCTSLASVTCWATSASLGDDAFKYQDPENIGQVSILPNLTAIYVLSDLVDTYKGAEGWSDYADKIKAIPTSLPANAVEGTFAGNWCTYYNSNANVQVDDNTTIYTISATSGSTATLHEVSGKIIKAGEGVILKSTASPIDLTYTSTAATDADYEGNLLAGVDAQTTISSSAYASKVIYTLANESGLGFYKYSGSTLAANKAFLALDAAPSGARGFTFTFDEGETTGMKDVRSDMEEGRGEYYNLNGQRIAHPTKGLYIKDGKKIMVK